MKEEKIQKGFIRSLFVCFFVVIFSSVTSADVKQGSVPLILICPEIIDLEVLTEKVELIPGPEDYARDSVMRFDVIGINIFTNASGGAELYTYGVQPTVLNETGHLTNVLRLEDVFLKVNKNATYIIENKIEGAAIFGNVLLSGLQDKWVNLNNEANPLMKVSTATKSKRTVGVDVAVTNLSYYTTGSYRCTIWFSLIPKVV